MSELPAEKLRRTCDQESFGCYTSSDIEKLDAIIGQERAVRALQFGLGIHEKGFNIFVAGIPGTGRTTAVKLFLEEQARTKPAPSDWVYVNNFHDASRPKALRLPPGKAREFKADLNRLFELVGGQIRSVFESEEYAANREKTMKVFQKQKEELFERMNRFALEQGFAIQSSQMGILTVPLKDGKPFSEEEFMALSQEQKEIIANRQGVVQSELAATIRQARQVDKSIADSIEKLDREVATFATSHPLEDLKEKHPQQPEIIAFLEELQEDILENLKQFRSEDSEDSQATPAQMRAIREAQRRRYEVDVLVDNSDLKGAPVILETNPTYNNLFGTIEHEAQFGTLVTDFTLIRGGAAHRANGGYLVLPVEDVLRNPFAWDALKRSLENNQLLIEDASEKIGVLSTKSLRPAPIPLDIKVVLIGTQSTFQLLQSYDDDFPELFKVKADFDIQMERNQEHVQEYVAFIGKLCSNEKLKHLDAPALARVVEHGSRLADDQENLSTHFGVISDVIREASYYATQDGAELTGARHIQQTIEQRFYRSSLINQRLKELVAKDVIKIDVDGEKIGQVNGLSVMDLGDVSFGQPSRITVTIGLGREGLVDIEREAKMAGPIYTKGSMILSGFLTEKFAQEKPISLSARLVFEQSYSGVEGDSASSTELYAILSALSGIPIKQGIAVTGSVNQRGEVQAIGGVNQKIEGFFEICNLKGLTGSQGVMIPESNARNLMLKEEVVEAVREGKFHIWSVKNIEEGIEILTGVSAAGEPQETGYDPKSVFGMAQARLNELSEKLESAGKPKTEGSRKYRKAIRKKV